MTKSFSTHLRKCHFDTAFVADDTAVLHTFVFAAQALPVRHRAENAGAEKTVFLRFEGSVIDGLRLRHFTVRPGTNLLWGGQTDSTTVKIGNGCRSVVRIRSNHVHLPLNCWLSFHEFDI